MYFSVFVKKVIKAKYFNCFFNGLASSSASSSANVFILNTIGKANEVTLRKFSGSAGDF